jgi:type II secretory ATPase GspE/PulE/Tfp pilus assembly ATPase PilB-like protein
VGQVLTTMRTWQKELGTSPRASSAAGKASDSKPSRRQVKTPPEPAALDANGGGAPSYEARVRKPATRIPPEDEPVNGRAGHALGFGKFDYLIAQGCVTQQELAEAVRKARLEGSEPETVLMREYGMSRAELGASLAHFYQIPFIEFDPRITVDPELLKDLKLDFLRKHSWLPLRRDHAGVLVLIDTPHDLRKVDSIRMLLPRDQIRFAVGLREDIARFIAAEAAKDPAAYGLATMLSDLKADRSTVPEDGVYGEVDENDSTIVRFANRMILDACKRGVSDIHVEPRGSRKETVIRFRVDGGCFEYERVPPSFRAALVARLKIMAQLDIAERRKPQDGKIKFQVGDREVELRVATVPTAGSNEDVVMRILTHDTTIRLESLGMTERNLREIKSIAQKPYGLILCVGPTGSGKTTTLHALLDFLNKAAKKIWTAEDPVEITQEGLRQVQVQPKIGFTFAAALRAVLRADPDIIMVGEMRDQETAAIGVAASLTGHLVLSTLHTNSAAETVVRLLDMGIDPFTFADAMLGILAQRLVKCICANCRESYHPPREAYEDLAETYGRAEWDRLGIPYDSSFVLYRGRGCTVCNKTGYKGRAGIHELLMASDEIKRLVQTRARVSEILAQAKAEGMTTLVQDGILKSLKGVMDLIQVRAVAIK